MVRKERTYSDRSGKNKQLVKKFDQTSPNEVTGVRIPICFCIDTSLSMNALVDDADSQVLGKTVTVDGQTYDLVTGGRSIKDIINERLKDFYSELVKESHLPGIEIAIVTFDDVARVSQQFSSVTRTTKVPVIAALGQETCLSDGLALAMEQVRLRKAHYDQQEVSRRQPWLIIMTDGKTQEVDGEIDQIVGSIVQDTKDLKLNLIVGSISDDFQGYLKELQKGNDYLNEKKPGLGNPPFYLDTESNINQFFRYITKTITESRKKT